MTAQRRGGLGAQGMTAQRRGGLGAHGGAPLQVVLAADMGRGLPGDGPGLPAGGPRRPRQFILGRLAARSAVRRVLGSPSLQVEIHAGPDGMPMVRCGGAGPVAVSISHSGRLAAACAWYGESDQGWAAGVDVERLRPTSVADSSYAFSPREQRLLARMPEGPALAGLAAWTAKEAAWKAAHHLATPGHGGQREAISSPAALEIRSLSLRAGRAVVAIGPNIRDRCHCSTASVRTGLVQGPDGWYLLSIARVRRDGCRGNPPWLPRSGNED